MNSVILCVRDQKVGAYGEPFTAPSLAAAVRSIKSAVEDGKSDISKYPEDFDLYQVGEYSPIDGKLTAFDSPVHLTSALAFVNNNVKEL